MTEIETCAGDGTCAIPCPIGINTGALIREFRAIETTSMADKVALQLAKNWSAVETVSRASLSATHAFSVLFGVKRLRTLARRSNTPRQPVSSHTRSKASAGPMRRVEIAIPSPRSSASSTIALSAKRAPERKSRSNCPLFCRSSALPSVAITCWRTAAPSRRALDDLQIGATAEGLLAEIHGGKPGANSNLVRTPTAYAQIKASKSAHYVGGAGCANPSVRRGRVPCRAHHRDLRPHLADFYHNESRLFGVDRRIRSAA